MRTLLLILLAFPSLLLADGLTFPKPLLELDVPVEAKSITADFAFTNSTDKPVTILRHESECSCMVIEPVGKKLRYEPGESGILHTTFDKGRYMGTVDKNIKLWLVGDPADKPSSLLQLRVHIQELITLSPKTVSWKIGDPGTEAIVKITITGDTPVRITNVTCSNPNFPHRLTTLKEGKSYELAIRCTSTTTSALGVFKIESESSDEGQRVAQIFGVVR